MGTPFIADNFEKKIEVWDFQFSSSSGKMTITLQDVIVLLWLYIDGRVVARRDVRDWWLIVWGIQPPYSAIRGGAVKPQCLCDQLTVIQVQTNMEVEKYARGYILHMQIPLQIKYILDGYLS